MRIVIACSSRDRFGSDRSAVRTGQVLRDLGHDVLLGVPAHRPEAGLAEICVDAGLPIIELPMSIATSRGISGRARLRAVDAADLVVVNSSAIVAVPVRARRRILVVREWLSPRNPLHRALVRWHRGRYDTVVGVSRGVVDQVQALGGLKAPARVVHNWIEDQWLSGAEAAGEGIACVGRFNQWKGQHTLLRAYQRAFSPTNAPCLRFLGREDSPGRFRARADAVSRAGEGWPVAVEEAVADVQSVFDRAALVVVPSLHPEPFGNVLLEALARGCKVIAFPGGGPNDVARHTSALRVVRRTEESLAGALTNWVEGGGEPQRPQELASTLDALRSRFSSDAATRAWDETLDARSGGMSRRGRPGVCV